VDLAQLESRLVAVLGRHPSVILAYIFGSAARGDVHAGSDLDLAVLFADTSLAAYRSLWADVHDALAPQPFDLVTLNGADPVLAFEVISEGDVLLSRSDEELNDFERKAWHRYQDTRHLRAIGDRYLLERSREWSSSQKPSANASSDSRK
jgi:predicted nucleotidyltransferase